MNQKVAKQSGFDNSAIRKSIISALVCVAFSSIQLCQTAFGWGNYESRLLFHPINKNISDMRLDLKDRVDDIYFYSMDGIRLNAWYAKAQGDKPTIVYCHGQGENISLWQSVMETIVNSGYGILMLEYRGHGRSLGSPSETGLYLDLESAIKYLKENNNIPQDKIVLWGRSLGGAVVADIASRDKFKAVILESTFTNIRDEAIHIVSTGILESKLNVWEGMSMKFVKFMPMVQKFETDTKIQKITSPLLIGASENDTTVPCDMSIKLAKLNNKAIFFLSEKGSHHESEWFKDEAISFLNNLTVYKQSKL